MKDLADAVTACRTLTAAGGGVLATVVATRGSTYRRPGARMVVAADGTSYGMVGGGCADTDLLERARRVLASGRPEHVVYDTTGPDDLVWGLGLGCNGVVEVLLEPLPPGEVPPALAAAAATLADDRPALLATVVAAPEAATQTPGGHLLVVDDAVAVNELGDGELAGRVASDAAAALAAGASITRRYPAADGEVTVFLEVIEPPVALLVVGAGADAIPLVRAAAELGWRVTVADHRPAFAVPERFPEADAVILCEPAELCQRVRLSPRSAVVVLTHSYRHDLELLRHLLASTAFYVGVIGPSRRRRMLLDELAASGDAPAPEQLARLYGPVGLDVGAETAAEIALAIVAEVQAVRAGRPGGPLRDRPAPIHAARS